MSARGRVTLKPLAIEYLGEQFKYLSDESLDAALRFLDAVMAAFDWLLEFPGAGTPYPPLGARTAGIRRWSIREFPKHLIYYRPTEDGVDILRVLHGARDVQKMPMESGA